jgi:hypothetical protein
MAGQPLEWFGLPEAARPRSPDEEPLPVQTPPTGRASLPEKKLDVEPQRPVRSRSGRLDERSMLSVFSSP